MKKIKKYLAVPLAIAISLMGYGGQLVARAEESVMEINKEYESFDQEEDVSSMFEKELEKGGKKYRLRDVEAFEIGSRPEIEANTVSIQTEPIYGIESEESALPADTIERDGETYYLIDSEIMTAISESRTEYGKATINFEKLEYEEQVPGMGEVTVTDTSTGKMYVKSLPRSGYTVIAEKWVDDFSFPIKIYSVDADYYMLGNTQVAKGTDLSQYGEIFLNYLELSTEKFRVERVTLGESYEENGELVQEAIAYGSRRTVDVAATYEGSVTIPQETGWYYDCTYSTVPPDEEVKTVYKMQATATYELVSEPVIAEAEPAEGFIKQLINWISEHPVISVVVGIAILSGLASAILMFLARKRREVEE